MAPPEKYRPRTCLQSLRKALILHKLSTNKTVFWIIASLVLLSSLLIILRVLLSHNISLDIPSLCAINQKLHSRGLSTAGSAQQYSNSYWNATKFSILTLVDGNALSSMAGPYPSFLESRSLYASLHGYALRVYFHRPDVRRRLVWSKILAIREIFYPDTILQGSTANTAAGDRLKSLKGTTAASDIGAEEWVWVLDLDALIFNFNVKLESIVESAGARGGGGGVDMIIACDHNGLNAGSFLMRKSEWSREFLRRWWVKGNEEGVPVMDKLFEQAALTEMVQRDKGVAAHVHIAAIREFNAYGYPSGELYQFQEGDFVVHCPGPTLKKWLPAYAREWEKMMHHCSLRELWMNAGLQFEQEDLPAT